MTINRHYSVIVHQVTSPRAVQAFLVISFGLTIIIMAMATMPIPEIMTYSLAAIIGYYFGDSQERLPQLVTTNGSSVETVAAHVDDTLARGGSVPRRVPVDPLITTRDDPDVAQIVTRANLERQRRASSPETSPTVSQEPDAEHHPPESGDLTGPHPDGTYG